jgi:3-dehydroquinate synthetase
LPKELAERQRRLIQSFGLPTSCADVDRVRVLGAVELDKKVRERTVRWVLLTAVGKPVLRDDVPLNAVVSVLEELLT